MSRHLPEVTDDAALEALLRDDAVFAAGVRAIGERHAVPASSAIVRFPSGSRPVYAVGEELVLKLFAPFDRAFWETEVAALRAVGGRLPIPTPCVEAAGELDGWTYVLMTQLRGRGLAEAWPEIAPEERLRIADVLGACLATLHALDVPAGPGLAGDWPAFVADQRAGASSRQRKLGLPDAWADQIDGYLERHPLPDLERPVLLHTEVMREHLLAIPEQAGRWRLSGLFDFEPSMRGAPEYELASLGIFVACGDAAILRRCLRAYGYAGEALGAELQQRTLAWALLHRYAHLPWYLRRIPPAPEVQTLEELAGVWWAL